MFSRGEEGRLAIVFFSAPTMFFLPDLIRRFRVTHQAVTVQLKELTPDKQLEAFARNEIDVGFTRPLPSGYQYLKSVILFEERLLAVLPETHPLAGRTSLRLSELAAEQFVLLDRPVAVSLYDHVISMCRESGFSPIVMHTPDLMNTLLMMVAAEQGVSIVPEGVLNLRENQLSFVPIIPSPSPIPLLICWNTVRDNPARTAFLNLVQNRKVYLNGQS
ncbi:LysR family substrate-binding domain-containing protein [Desulfovibrio gilichinskyi]|uniref:LysR substrate binding domain-containing protein n=1 Tax=Desulfovibrio gilichinskyi TaxID=1519643 RepID=A0A1X7E797_9BACT|nr:LysR family substrate-binding domain-containing protein [Desulfovibrio gilichinskyi]SMF28855.1 LysR substrate binding domain-containing protein [Desulfovibrio gilichinskyi]